MSTRPNVQSAKGREIPNILLCPGDNFADKYTPGACSGPILTNVWVNCDDLNYHRVGILHLALLCAIRVINECK
jgi:hypothetical protein